MDKKDIDRISKIITILIVRNMERGANLETAKTQVFNRMVKEYPGVLKVWLKYA